MAWPNSLRSSHAVRAPAPPTVPASLILLLVNLLTGRCLHAFEGADVRTRLSSISDRLNALGWEADCRHRSLSALESVRVGLLAGERVELASAYREHLELGSALVGETTFDSRHRPLSTDTAKHFTLLRVLAEDVTVRFHSFMPLRRVASSTSKTPGPAALLLVVDDTWQFSAFDPDAGGSPLLGPIDLGHGPGRFLTHMVSGSSQENHVVVTADDLGRLRVHSLRVVVRRENVTKVSDGVGSRERSQQRMIVTANVSCNFSLPATNSVGGEQPKLVSVLPVERGDKMFFVTGDSYGGIAVFHHNGTLKGRVRVTEDPGGIKGLLRGQSQSLAFFSTHSFGFFSLSQVDVISPPCSGWNAPLHDLALDPGFQSSRVVLALADGDVIAFTTMHGKSKACDLTTKFPHVSSVPFSLDVLRGHVVAVTSPLPEDPLADKHLREVYFFNLAAMDAGYGAGPSRTVTLQASFKPQQPERIVLSHVMGPGGVLDRSKAHAAIRFINTSGVHLYSLHLRAQPSGQADFAPMFDEDDHDEMSWWSLVSTWFPKVGVFGMVLIGVVIWNVRKATCGEFAGPEFDEDFFKEQLRKAREAERAENAARSGGGGLNLDED